VSVRRLPTVLGILAAVVGLFAAWWVLNNPTVYSSSLGEDYTCTAPYDTVLNDPDNVPGGEPST
jgi:hypothetical protein